MSLVIPSPGLVRRNELQVCPKCNPKRLLPRALLSKPLQQSSLSASFQLFFLRVWRCWKLSLGLLTSIWFCQSSLLGKRTEFCQFDATPDFCFFGKKPQCVRAEPHTQLLISGIKRRCKSCVDEFVEKAGYKRRRNALKKVNSLCSKLWDSFLCRPPCLVSTKLFVIRRLKRSRKNVLFSTTFNFSALSLCFISILPFFSGQIWLDLYQP